MKMLTVMDMYEMMQGLIAQGKGDLLVMMPNWAEEDFDGDFRSISGIEDDDISNSCVYLCGNDAEEENEWWAGRQ